MTSRGLANSLVACLSHLNFASGRSDGAVKTRPDNAGVLGTAALTSPAWHFSDLAIKTSAGLLCGVKRSFPDWVFDFRPDP